MSEPQSTVPDSRARIYYVNPLLLDGRDGWNEAFDHARSLGFNIVMSAPLFKRRDGGSVFAPEDCDQTDPSLGLPQEPAEALFELVAAGAARDIKLMLDLALVPGIETSTASSRALDPRRSPVKASGSGKSPPELLREWSERLIRFSDSGVAGYRLISIDSLSASDWAGLIAHVKGADNDVRFFAYTPGTDFAFRAQLLQCQLDGVFSSLAWWDFRESWLLEEQRIQSQIASQIAFPEAPFAKRLAHGTESREIRERKSVRSLHLAVSLGDGGLLVPMGFEFGAVLPLDPTYGHIKGLRALKAEGAFDISGEIRAVNSRPTDHGKFRTLRIEAAKTVTVIAQANSDDVRAADKARMLVVNADLRRASLMPDEIVRHTASPFLPVANEAPAPKLLPGEVRLLVAERRPAVVAPEGAIALTDAARAPRIAIEKVSPQVEDGRLPVKRIIGDVVTVQADIFADGHDLLAASLLYKACDEGTWRQSPMTLAQNDRWEGRFPLERLGRHEFRVEAWKNPFAIFRYELMKKNEARLDLRLELMEGEELIRLAIADPSETMTAAAREELASRFRELSGKDEAAKAELMLSARVGELMALADRRPFRVRSHSFIVDSERREAAFASWYQIFPRSQSGDPHRHGTFADVIARLPAIRDMGFDVLYFPPIHPIGRTNRKGRNNSLAPAPDDPGSPYAIGSELGGHDAIHPQLGTFEDFRALVAAAKKAGLELALDLAIQASPDHPWLKEHPGWFDWRADGTIRYAENPPKKYEDIVNVDFYAKDASPSLWKELLDIVDLWVEQGVRLFRVDNPHTKPFPFWEWLIADVRARHPDVVFLSEAFTRPKVMYRLAKLGFSQSYTYFTWRNARFELEEYMTELTRTEAREFFRPHFFVNTHDINPDFLQNASRPAYLIRAALAATLSGLWGVYNGFELCEGRPDAKRKEYADSEKYEIRAWDYDRPGNIKSEISMLNRIRRDNPALQSHLGLTLLNSANQNVMFYEKASPGRHNVLLIAVTLNPHHAEESEVEFPLWQFGIADTGKLFLEDLVSGEKFSRRGKRQKLVLNPDHLPFAIWRVRAAEA